MSARHYTPQWWDLVGMLLVLDRRLLIVIPALGLTVWGLGTVIG